jgi:hypothetical protein
VAGTVLRNASPQRYNRCPGGRVPRVARRLDLLLFLVMPRREDCMTDLIDLAALSLLPCSYFGRVAERLRRGDAAGAVLRGLVAEHWRDEPDKLSTLLSRGASGIRRAREGGITPLPWSDAA